MHYSKQRDAIINVLKDTTSHPTADEVFAEVIKLVPHLGIATVYRNLKALKENGRIKSIRVDGDKEHFDYNIKAHAHLQCNKCNKVIDIFLTEEQIANIKDIGKNNFDLIFIGLCDDCKKIIKEN